MTSYRKITEYKLGEGCNFMLCLLQHNVPSAIWLQVGKWPTVEWTLIEEQIKNRVQWKPKRDPLSLKKLAF